MSGIENGERQVTIDIDVGGTFTDGYFTHDDAVALAKVDTVAHDLAACLWACIERGADELGFADVQRMLERTRVIRFATTVGTNAILQGEGPKLGVLVTRGEEERLYGSDSRSPLLDRFLRPELIAGVANGPTPPEVEPEVDEAAVRAALKRLLDQGARHIVVALRNAGRDDRAERRAREIVHAYYPKHYVGSVPLVLSTQVRPRLDDYTRTNVTVINAYLHRDLAHGLHRAEDRLREAGYQHPLLVTHASGGAARVAKTRAIDTYHSGPVAGLFGSARFATAYGLAQVVTADVGGTSTDIGVILDGAPRYGIRAAIADVPVQLPFYEVEAIAGGGGTIARPGRDRSVRLGPDSVGALPGPAAYGLGGEDPTVTDACLVLGWLDPDYFLGGRRRLDPDAAERAVREKLADALGIGVERAALAIVAALEEAIADAVRRSMQNSGRGTEEWALFAYGGAGGLFAARVADRVGASAYLFRHGSVLSAFGSSAMDAVHLYERPVGVCATADPIPVLVSAIETMQAQADRDMRGEGFAPDSVLFSVELELVRDGKTLVSRERFSGDWGATLATALARVSGTAEVIAVRLVAEAPVSHAPLTRFPAAVSDSITPKAERVVVLAEGRRAITVIERASLATGHRVAGPALVEGPDTTILVPPGYTMVIDRFHNGLLSRKETA